MTKDVLQDVALRYLDGPWKLTPPVTTLEPRCVISGIHIPDDEPIILANLHGVPGKNADTRELVVAIMNRAKKTGRKLIAMGGFNLTPEQGVVAGAVTNGWLYLPETPEEALVPTRKAKDTLTTR